MSDNRTTKSSANNDDRLSKILKDELPGASSDEWFFRKVMNRLPDRKPRPRTSVAERIFYLLGVIVLFSGWGYNLIHTLHHGLTPTSLIIAAIVPVVALFCLCIIFMPALRRTI